MTVLREHTVFDLGARNAKFQLPGVPDLCLNFAGMDFERKISISVTGIVKSGVDWGFPANSAVCCM